MFRGAGKLHEYTAQRMTKSLENIALRKMKHSDWIRPAQEDLDQFDGIEHPQDDGSPPLFLSIGATLSCLGGVPLGMSKLAAASACAK